MAAIHTPDPAIEAHLKTCATCRFLFDHLQLQVEEKAEKDLFSSALYRSAALAALERARHPASKIDGALSFDSWAQQPAAVRAVEVAEERRLTFSAGDYTLELVVEKQQQCWECTARLYCNEKPQSHFILEVGRRRLHTESRRCYFWRMNTPPRSIAISSGEIRIDLGEIAW